MLFHPVKVPVKVFSILFKIHWACCVSFGNGSLRMETHPIMLMVHCTVPLEGESCIDTPIGKNPKLAFYCRNQKFGSILEEGNHSQHFLKPRSALDFVLLSAVFTLFFQFLQFSIGKKNVFFNYGQGGSIPRLFFAKIYHFYL